MIINLTNGVLDVSPILPTKSSDYDYDPNNPSKRFYYTILYDIVFKDKITNIESFRLLITLDTFADMMRSIYRLLDGSSRFISINNGIYATYLRQPCIMAISKSSSDNTICMSILNMKYNFSFTLTQEDIPVLEQGIFSIDT